MNTSLVDFQFGLHLFHVCRVIQICFHGATYFGKQQSWNWIIMICISCSSIRVLYFRSNTLLRRIATAYRFVLWQRILSARSLSLLWNSNKKKRSDLTQSDDKCPYNHRKIQKATWQQKTKTKQTPPKTLRTDWGRSVGVTIVTQLVLNRFAASQPSH